MKEATQEEVEDGLMSPNLEIRKYFAEYKGIRPSNRQMMRGIKDKSPVIRYIFIKRFIESIDSRDEYTFDFTYFQMKIGLKDEDDNVRSLFMKMNDKVCSQEDINIFLKDKSNKVILELLRNKNISLTGEQLENILITSNSREVKEMCIEKLPHTHINKSELIDQMLNESDPEIRKCFICRNPNLNRFQLEKVLMDTAFGKIIMYTRGLNHVESYKIPSGFTNEGRCLLNYEQVERGLMDPNPIVRMGFCTSDFKLTKRQIERGLKDDDCDVRSCFVVRYVGSLTEKQINERLKDTSPQVRFWLARAEITLEQLEVGITDEDLEVRCQFIRRKSVYLNEEQIDRILKGNCESSKGELIVQSHTIRFNEEQVDYILTDKISDDNRSNRLTFLSNCIGVKLTQPQIEYVLSDSDKGIVGALKERPDYLKYTEKVRKIQIK